MKIAEKVDDIIKRKPTIESCPTSVNKRETHTIKTFPDILDRLKITNQIIHYYS